MLLKPLAAALALSTITLFGPSILAQVAPGPRTQVRFAGPSGMKVRWYTRTADGRERYSEPPLEVPARYNFRQGAGYRLKLTDIPGRPGLELFPTLEVRYADPASQDFLAHNAVAVTFTDEDFRQVEAGNYLVKVVYLGGEGGVSSVVGVGTDPVAEAQRRGSILLVIRMGNRDRTVP